MRARACRRSRFGAVRESISAVKRSLAVDQRAAEALIAGALRAILMCIDANLRGRENDYPDAVAESQAIEDRARSTGVYSP